MSFLWFIIAIALDLRGYGDARPDSKKNTWYTIPRVFQPAVYKFLEEGGFENAMANAPEYLQKNTKGPEIKKNSLQLAAMIGAILSSDGPTPQTAIN